MIILSTAYLGNIQYYTKLLSGNDVIIDTGENYQKQSYRNRCDIMGANGMITLTVPVLKSSGEKTSVNNTRIDYRKGWRHQHWYSIMSAYKNSPFFDYLADELEPFYKREYEYLWEFNMGLSAKVLEILGADIPVRYSDGYVEAGPEDLDFRNSISRKPRLRSQDNHFTPLPYYQVFADKHGFAPNLSIIDLLFCEGMGSAGIIRESSSFSPAQ